MVYMMNTHTHTSTHTHTHTHIYMCVCVCVCIYIYYGHYSLARANGLRETVKLHTKNDFVSHPTLAEELVYIYM